MAWAKRNSLLRLHRRNDGPRLAGVIVGEDGSPFSDGLRPSQHRFSRRPRLLDRDAERLQVKDGLLDDLPEAFVVYIRIEEGEKHPAIRASEPARPVNEPFLLLAGQVYGLLYCLLHFPALDVLNQLFHSPFFHTRPRKSTAPPPCAQRGTRIIVSDRNEPLASEGETR